MLESGQQPVAAYPKPQTQALGLGVSQPTLNPNPHLQLCKGQQMPLRATDCVEERSLSGFLFMVVALISNAT